MDPEEREELKKQMLASLEETKRMVAETRQMADAMEADLSRVLQSGSTTEASSESSLPHNTSLADKERSLAEMRNYIDKVKWEIEEQRRYNRLPWWKKLFRDRPSLA